MVSFVPRVNSLRNNRVCKFAMNRTFYFFFSSRRVPLFTKSIKESCSILQFFMSAEIQISKIRIYFVLKSICTCMPSGII